MGEVGIISPDERVELIDGQVERMSPVGNWHFRAVAVLTRLLPEQLGPGLLCSPAGGLNVGRHTQLVPDFVIARDSDDWEVGLSGAECLLVVEVSHSSLSTDRTRKKAIYAAEDIPEYWIVDLAGRAVEVYADPRGGSFRSGRRLERGQVVESVSVPGLVVPVSAITPPDGADSAADEQLHG